MLSCLATISGLHYQVILKKAMKVDLGPRLAPYYSDAGWGAGSRFFVARRAAGPDGEGSSTGGGGAGGGSGQALCCVGVRNRKHGSAELMYMAVRCAGLPYRAAGSYRRMGLSSCALAQQGSVV